MIKRIRLRGAYEYDALTRARRYYTYLKKAGVAKSLKRKYNKRFRKTAKEAIRNGTNEI